MALAHRLLHGWQVQQTITQGCLTQWQQTLQALETVGGASQRQAEALQAQTGQRRRAPWWALLAGVCLPVPSVPETMRPSNERSSSVPDALLAPPADDTPAGDGP
jgi:hypothetical protein